MQREIISDRRRKIRSALRQRGFDGLVSVSKQNVQYLTGFTGGDSAAVLTGRSVTLVTDSRYTEQAEAETADTKIYEREKSLHGAVADVLNRSKKPKMIAVENTATIAFFNGLRKALDHKLKYSAGSVEDVRRAKSADEIKCIGRAVKIAWQALEVSLEQLQAGMTESALAARLVYEICSRGSESAFEPVVAFGSNASRAHHHAGTRRLKKNDTILIDFGAAFDGYRCDITRCFAVGKISAQYRKAYDAVYKAQRLGIKNAAEGVKCSELDEIARRSIKDQGLPPYGHGLGHGLGLNVHERPGLSRISKDKLRTGDVVTVEPGIYLPGKFGIRIEDDIALTPKGVKVLTKTAHKYSDAGKIPLIKI